MSNIKVTVLMPAYNAANFIAEAINSVLQQSFTSFELLIINDGSTDNTSAVINSFTDSRIRLIEQNNQGVSAALNKGLKEATAEYIARFDADDICFPQRLKKQVEFLDANPNHVLVGSGAEYITEEGEYLFNFTNVGHNDEDIRKKLYTYCPFIHSSVMYRKRAVLLAGGYAANAHSFEDYLLWVQLAEHGLFQNLKEQLIKVRLNPSSVTIDEKWRGRRFRKLKREIIYKGFVTEAEGNEILYILKKQDNTKIKKGAYNILCGKKILLDNYQPQKARTYFRKAINYHPFRADSYALYMLSFFPKSFINWLHSKSPNKI
jgi:glycosyltransferase involved in cell wall biosynthesis